MPERSGTSPLPASELTTAEFGQLKAVQQLSVLQLPGVTCQAAGDARLKSQSVPSSPIHGNKTFITRSLSLQKSLETDNLQQQVSLGVGLHGCLAPLCDWSYTSMLIPISQQAQAILRCPLPT